MTLQSETRTTDDQQMLAHIHGLRQRRPQNHIARTSGLLLALGVGFAWLTTNVTPELVLGERAQRNLSRFWNDIRPYPLQDRSWDWGIYAHWLRETFADIVTPAIFSTACLAILAIVLAAIGGFCLSLFAARNLGNPEPFAAAPGKLTWQERFPLQGLGFLVRLGLTFLRAIPEYIWAYLFLGLFGLGPWPAILALAVHNTGILGRLDAEIIENQAPQTPLALRALGSTRKQLIAAVILPSNFNRFLVFFFYRWETCIREATVLGLLGFVSLGWYIQEARAGTRYDEMLHLVWMGSALILGGDFLSFYVRRWIRS